MESLKIVWHDPNIFNSENTTYVSRYLSGMDYRLFSTVKEAVDFLAGNQNTWILVTSGRNGQEIVQRVHDFPMVIEILVFCGNPALHQQWACHFPKIKDLISSSFGDVVKRAVSDWNQMALCAQAEMNSSKSASSLKIDPLLKLTYYSTNQLDINFYGFLKPYLQNYEIKRDDILSEFQAFQNDLQPIIRIFNENQDDLLRALILGYMQNPFFQQINDCYNKHHYQNISNITNGCLYLLRTKPELMMQQPGILYREANIPADLLLSYSRDYKGYWSSFTFATLKKTDKHIGNVYFEIHFAQYSPHPNMHLKSLISNYDDENELLLLPYFPFIVLSVEPRKKYTKIIVRQDEHHPSLSFNNELIYGYWKYWISTEIQEPFFKICSKTRDEDINSITLSKYFITYSNDGETQFIKDFKILVHRCYQKNKDAIIENFNTNRGSWVNQPLTIYWNIMKNDIRNSLIFSMKSWLEKPFELFFNDIHKILGKIHYEEIPKLCVSLESLSSVVSVIFSYADAPNYAGSEEKNDVEDSFENKILEHLGSIINIFGRAIASGAVAYGKEIVSSTDKIKDELNAKLTSLQQSINYVLENALAY